MLSLYIYMRHFAASLLLLLTVPFWALGQTTSAAERAVLEAQLKEIEAQIEAYEKTIGTYQKQGKTLNGEIATMNAKTKKLNLEIKAITLSLSKLDKEIAKNHGDIKVTTEKLQSNTEMLEAALQSLHEKEGSNLVEVLVMNPTLSAFFNNVDNLTALQGTLKDALKKTIATRDELLDLKQSLAEKKTDTASLKAARAAQTKAIAQAKKEKDALLKETK